MTSLRHRVLRWSALFGLALPGVLLVLALALLWAFLSNAHPERAVPITLAAAVVGSLLLAGSLWMARALAVRWFMTGLDEVIRAGDWALRQARGDSPLGDVQDELPERAGHAAQVSVISHLEDWLHVTRSQGARLASVGTRDVERDLELAREFQQAYLNRPYPKIPEVHVEGRLRLEFHHRYAPALALGGDFFDIMKLAPDCCGVFIADVMGHGTRSALITSILRTLIGDLQHQGRNAPHFLTELNKQFCDILRTVPNPLFASAYYFVPDTTARVATFSSAGHPAPFLVRSHLSRVTRLEVPPPRGSALGLVAGESFTGGHVRLTPGDVFLFFTDGVYEAHNARGEEFGIVRVEAILNKLVYRGAREMVDAIMKAVTEFVGSETVTDDICMVAVEVTDKAAASETRS